MPITEHSNEIITLHIVNVKNNAEKFYQSKIDDINKIDNIIGEIKDQNQEHKLAKLKEERQNAYDDLQDHIWIFNSSNINLLNFLKREIKDDLQPLSLLPYIIPYQYETRLQVVRLENYGDLHLYYSGLHNNFHEFLKCIHSVTIFFGYVNLIFKYDYNKVHTAEELLCSNNLNQVIIFPDFNNIIGINFLYKWDHFSKVLNHIYNNLNAFFCTREAKSFVKFFFSNNAREFYNINLEIIYAKKNYNVIDSLYNKSARLLNLTDISQEEKKIIKHLGFFNEKYNVILCKQRFEDIQESYDVLERQIISLTDIFAIVTPTYIEDTNGFPLSRENILFNAIHNKLLELSQISPGLCSISGHLTIQEKKIDQLEYN